MDHDSPQIGSQRPMTEILPAITASTPTRPPLRSVTTGTPSRERGDARSIGPQLGETGAVATPVNPKTVKAFALFDLPLETMRSISVSLALRLVVEGKSLFGSHGFERTGLGSFYLSPGSTLNELKTALHEVERACLRSSAGQIAPIVAKLAMRTKMRVQGEGEAALLAETMVDDLSAYPLDVVEWACDFWVRGGADFKFFPSWPELRDICERRMEGRRRLERCLTWHIANYQAAP